ncbi:MAG: hypothetical protein ACLP5H_00580 [Desulfomonilaceae bacterium]
MKKKSKDVKTDDLRPEYDLRGLLRAGIQGKYADRYERAQIWSYWTMTWPRLSRRTKP